MTTDPDVARLVAHAEHSILRYPARRRAVARPATRSFDSDLEQGIALKVIEGVARAVHTTRAASRRASSSTRSAR
jgi:hypothetical protein